MGTRSDCVECLIKHLAGKSPSFAMSLEKKQKPGRETAKKKKRKKVKTVTT